MSATDGKLRLRFFGCWKYEADKVIAFIREHCDIIKNGSVSDCADELPEWYQTGVNLQQFGDRIKDAFGIRY